MEAEKFDIPESFYFHGEEIEQFIHIQIPISLIKDEVFRDISDSSKLLYGLLLNRTWLSARNDWRDENGRTFIVYTIESLMEDLGVGSTKAKRMFAELSNINGTGIGLIRKVRVQNKPSKIYVLNFMEVRDYLKEVMESGTSVQIVQKLEGNAPEAAETLVGCECVPRLDADASYGGTELRLTVRRGCVLRSDADASHGETEMRPTEGPECVPWPDADESQNNKDIIDNDMIDKDTVIKSDTDINLINHINEDDVHDEKDETDVMDEIDSVREMFRKNIRYDFFSKYPDKYDINTLDYIVEFMAEEYVCGGDEILGGHKVPHELIKKAFENFNALKMKYVLQSLAENTTRVKNTRKYLLRTLYDAPLTFGIHQKLRFQNEIEGMAE